MSQDILTQLADHHGTDKGSLFHSYTPFYAILFGSKRFDFQHVLEIGTLRGASLLMWRDYFTGAQIHGIDNLPGNMIARPRIASYLADQGDASQMKEVAQALPELDLVLDDGSHVEEHQRNSFEILWRKVKVGGFYVVEDIEKSYDLQKQLLSPLGPSRSRWFFTAPSGGQTLVLRKDG